MGLLLRGGQTLCLDEGQATYYYLHSAPFDPHEQDDRAKIKGFEIQRFARTEDRHGKELLSELEKLHNLKLTYCQFIVWSFLFESIVEWVRREFLNPLFSKVLFHLRC